MDYYVFRNQTVERFFPKSFSFSGYDDISVIPETSYGYVWFYQIPFRSQEEVLCEEIRGYSEKLRWVLDRIPSTKTFILITMDGIGVTPMTSGLSLLETVVTYNLALLEAANHFDNVKVVDICEFTRAYPMSELTDGKYWFLSQMQLNPRLSAPFMEWFQRKIDQIAMKRKKGLILDLDNTLWGGVLGEEGPAGIRIGGDYPGKAFHAFQEKVQELGKNGVILALCSKNNEADVWEAFDKNPFMVLRKDDFAAWRINWADKATNIRELAEELNIGLDSFVFVDDNPSEREWIRQALPMVTVPEFPSQPYGLQAFSQSLVELYFRVYSITKEDREKTEQYKANARRTQAQRLFSDMDSFLESLEICIDIEPADAFSIPRIAQMTQKTNQFNLTTRRYTETDIRTFLAAGWKIYCIRVTDRFGDNGITGCIFMNGDEIDSYLLSCRILGKGIEFAFIKSILRKLKESGKKVVRATYLPTAKNCQVKDFYDRCGFTIVAENEIMEKYYSLDLQTADLEIKPYYRITF